MHAPILVAASAAIIFVLGLIHLIYTYFTSKLNPSDPELKAHMHASGIVVAQRTSMWRAWVGFNASHSLGAMLFGAVYSYLTLYHRALLFESSFLAGCGLVVLLAYLTLAKLYWFHIPFRGIALATVLYIAGFTLALSLPAA